jgi:hypothetical protein
MMAQLTDVDNWAAHASREQVDELKPDDRHYGHDRDVEDSVLDIVVDEVSLALLVFLGHVSTGRRMIE